MPAFRQFPPYRYRPWLATALLVDPGREAARHHVVHLGGAANRGGRSSPIPGGAPR